MIYRLINYAITSIDRISGISPTGMDSGKCFNGGKTELQAIASHDRNKEARKFQEGGTAFLIVY
jgi:hypothetical protein